MIFSLTWLPEVLQRVGLKISEVSDWRTRGHGDMGKVRGVMVHHTVGASTGNMPSLNLLQRGRPDLSGPLAQIGLGRDGTFYIIAAGRAYHAGKGEWRGLTAGNTSFIGIEAENSGTATDPWPEVQVDALRRGVAAILQHVGADSSMVCGHKEYALPKGRKQDPLWEMAPFRESVAALIAGGLPPAPLIPVADDRARPTLRRGAKGPFVQALQSLLGVNPTGNFGPVTEAHLRAWQRGHALVPDGIAGPRTWLAIDPGGNAGSGPVAAFAPTAAATLLAGASGIATVNAASAVVVMPIADDAEHRVTTNDRHAIAPDGKSFALQTKLGFQANGKTSVESFVLSNPGADAGVSPSALRALSAVMANEGKLEAVNTYDNSFLSFGIMQWTAGKAGNDGELSSFLARLQRTDAAVFDECFGRYGLSASAAEGAMTGHLSLDGNALTSGALKAPLRSPEWTYRFWRAGHHPVVCQCQLAHGAGRIGRFISAPVHGHPLNAWLTSELGIAQVLDEHVNRPGHVPKTLESALGALIANASVSSDPASWSQAQEDQLITKYVAVRTTSTDMTNSTTRAAHLFDLAHDGKLSAARHSFA